MTLFKKNRLLRTALLIQLILLIMAAWDFFLPRFYLPLDSADIPFNGGYYDNGCHVNEETGNAGYFTYGPNVTLPRGVFTITIHYATDTDDNSVSCMGTNTSLNTLKYDRVTLPSAKTSQTFTLWNNKQIRNFQVATIYSGKGSLVIHSIEIAETYAGSTLMAFYILLFGGIADLVICLYLYYHEHTIKSTCIRNVLILAGAVIFASFPLFTDYLTEGHDLLFHLLRIEGLKDGLLSGQFPVKIQPTQLNGYGYAASVFYGDLFLYIPALLRIAGLSVQGAYMWFVFLVNLATVLVGFYSFHGIFKDKSLAVFSTVLFTLCPYRLINIYGRAAVGEYTAMVFLPLLAYGLYRIFTEDINTKAYKRSWLIPVIAYTGIIESHILSCEMVGLFTIIICLLLIKKVFVKPRFLVLVKVVVFTILANLGFLVPLADYMLQRVCIISEGAMTTSNIQQSGLYPARLFTFFLNGDSMPYSRTANYELGMQGEMGISVGIALLSCLLLFFYFMLIQEKKKSTSYSLGKFAFLIASLTLIMSVDIFPWDFLSRISFGLAGSVQFPWRFLGIGSVALAITAGCALEMSAANLEAVIRNCIFSLVIFTAILTSSSMLDDLLDNEPAYRVYSANALRTETSGTYFNEYAPVDTEFDRLDGRYFVSEDSLVIDRFEKKYTAVRFHTTNASGQNQYIELPLLYYPGYQARETVQGTSLECSSGSNNLVRVIVPSGFEGDVAVKYHQSPAWILSEIISLLTMVYLLFVGLTLRKIKRFSRIK